ncbi:MAG: cytochrome [Moraxellaceae bacterium]|nr:MAG: cytochrome [Moraxellaceae bacterium]
MVDATYSETHNTLLRRYSLRDFSSMDALDMPKYDLSSHEFVSNPYPTYRRLHEESPIYWCEERKYYYVSNLEYVKSIFVDSRASSDRVAPMVENLSDFQRSAIEPLTSTLSKWILFQDPPKHTPLRKFIVQSLSSKVVDAIEPKIYSVVDELIDDFSQQGDFDLIQDFAYPLPAIVISILLGVPVEDRDKIKAWSDTIARFLGEKNSLSLLAKAQQDIVEMTGYFRDILDQQRSNPKENVMSKMIALQQQQPELDDEHIIANCIGLIFAGHETTTHLIANTWLALQQHPDQLSLLRENPDLIESAIEESLRYESPVQRMGRFIKEPIEMGGQILKPGRRVLLLMGAANRDPSLIDRPNSFDIRRTASRHLAFGHGIHLCPGAALGRLEARIAIQALCQRLKNSTLINEQPIWQYNLGLRAMETCPVSIS